MPLKLKIKNKQIKSPRKKSPRKKSPRKKSPRKQSPRKKSPRKQISKKKASPKKKILLNNLNTNIVLKKGYCEASIMDDNDLEDPCNIHTNFNECENETKDTDFWRSYDCKWKE